MCYAEKEIAEAVLICVLPGVDHEWHYDDVDDVSWKEGRPDGTG